MAGARITAVTGNYARAISLLRQACDAHPEEGRGAYRQEQFCDLWKRMQEHAATKPQLLKKVQRASAFATDLLFRETEKLPLVRDSDLATLERSVR